MDCVNHIPAHSLTATRMYRIKHRVLEFVSTKSRLPTTLSELPDIPKFDNKIVDGWGRPILFETDSSNLITLKCFGSDGMPGGTDMDRDIVGAFRASTGSKGGPQDSSGWVIQPREMN